jgi:hypothetical protein
MIPKTKQITPISIPNVYLIRLLSPNVPAQRPPATDV